MSEPIKIVVTAETAEAAAKLQQFVAQTGNGFQMIAQDAATAGAATTQHMGGMVYQFRSAMDAIRFAAMDGGPRAAFYAVDEALRGLMASGLAMSTVLPPLAAVAAIVGVAALGWRNYTADERHAAEEAKNLGEALEKIPDQLKDIEAARQAGVLDAATAQKYADYLSGKRKLYNNHGEITEQGSLFPTGGADPDAIDSSAMLPEATVPERQKFVAGLQETDKLTNGGKPDPRIEAGVKLQALEREAQLEAITDEWERKKLETADHYLKTRNEINAALTLKGDRATDTDKAFAAKAIADNRAAQDAALAKIDEEAQKKQAEKEQAAARQEAEAEATIKEFYANEAKAAIQSTEDQITANNEKAGADRGALIQQEYAQRVQTAQDALAIGGITEDEYTHLVEEAAHKRTEAEKEYNAQLERRIALQQESAQDEAEAKLRAIDSNPFLSNDQKDQQSIPVWQQEIAQKQPAINTQLGVMENNPANSEVYLQAQSKMNDLLGQQEQIQEKINAAQNKGSFAAQLQIAITQLQNFNTLAQDTAELFDHTISTGISTISTNLAGVIEGTKTWNQALISIYNTIINEIIEGILKMAMEWIMKQAAMLLAGETAQTTATGTAATVALTLDAIWWTPAVLSTIATAGVAAADAPGLVAAAMFEDGGYTYGTRGQLAGMVHGEEFVFSAPAVDRIGRGTLEALASASPASASAVGRGSPAAASAQHKTDSFVYFDSNAMMDHLQKSDAHEKIIVDIMRRNVHKFR